jgi:hypothetical protein
MWMLVEVELQARIDQLVARGLDADRLIAGHEMHEHVGVDVQCIALLVGREADHGGIAGERAGAQAQHHAAARQVIEQREPVGHPQRVVIGQ